MNGKLGYLVITTVVFTVALLFLNFEQINVLEFPKTKVEAYKDLDIGGTSICSSTFVNQQFCYSYKLGSEAKYPYAGVSISKDSLYDLSESDFIEIVIRNPIKRRFHVYFSLNSINGNKLKFRTLVETSSDRKVYKLNIKDFAVPTWHIRDQNISEDEILKADLSKVLTFSFSNDVLSKIDVEDSFCIAGISLYSSNKDVFLIGVSLIFGFNLLWFLILRGRNKKLEINYIPTKVPIPDPQDLLEKDTNEIVAYISKNYTNPDLNLRMIRKSLRIPENKISQLLKERFELSYKDYINQIRLEEAKRLLVKGGLNINEVSIACGFGSIATFNRLFKEKIGATPTEFSNSTNT